MTCEGCAADIRCCKNCLFYSPGSFHDCAERVEDAVQDKERANFCDLFRIAPAFKIDHAPLGKRSGNSADDTARSAFDDLFK